MDYWRKIWQCPYFKWDDKLLVVCEGGRVAFPDKETARRFFDQYCAHMPGWRSCSIAAALAGFYERGGETDADE